MRGPNAVPPAAGLTAVGDLCRKEAKDLIVGYAFDLKTNDLVPVRLRLACPSPAKRGSGHVAMRANDLAPMDFDDASDDD